MATASEQRTASSTAAPDVVIRNVRVVDGTGNPWFYGDVAISGERIMDVTFAGLSRPGPETEVIDGGDQVIAPGFIDIQSHSIVPFLTDRQSLSKVTQGVTTEILGEAWTPAPFGGRIKEPFGPGIRRRLGDAFDEWDARARGWTRFGHWLDDLVDRGVSVNVGSFIGGSTVREFGKGEDMGDATPEERRAMLGCLEAAMVDGAFGIATALIYPPGAYASFDELVALCEVVQRYRGVHITHIRSEEDRILEALDEAIEIARHTGVMTEIYHLKAAGPRNWSKMPEAIRRIDAARAEGLDITADMYPYHAAGTGLAACLPYWASDGGNLYDNLRDPEMRARIAAEMREPTEDWENLAETSGPENVLIADIGHADLKQYQGMRLAEIAEQRGQDWVDAAIDLLATEGSNIFTMFFAMSDDNLKLQLRQPWIKISTDAGGVDPERVREFGLLHPRAYGTYTRVLARYVREEQVIGLEDAVRKMSASVADRLGLRDRGLLRSGMRADVIVFDPDTVQDHATWTNPHQLSTGIKEMWVNGQRVLREGQHTGATPGHWVKGTGAGGAI